MNGSGTDSKSDTPLTEDSLPSVRAALIALRAKHGADTPIGHRCSNLIGQLENYENVMGADRKRALDRNIAHSLKELAKLAPHAEE
jgi:hypothetical protein